MALLKKIAAYLKEVMSDGWRVSILGALPVAICAYLVALWLEKPSDQYNIFDQVSYLAIAVIFALYFALLLTRLWSTTTTVMAVIVLVYCQFIGKLVFLLYFNPHPLATQAEFTETFFWLPALFVLSAFVPGLAKGRLVVVLFFALFSAISVAYIVPNWQAGKNFGIIYALIEMILANVTLLTLTHNFLGFKESFAKTSARAEMMERLAYRDNLTNLPNRLALEQDLEVFIRQAPADRKIGVAFIDIDRFKFVNDSYGHAAGDHLLISVGERLKRASRKGDYVFRISGDEFVMIFGDLREASETPNVGERIRLALALPFQIQGHVMTVSASIGVALFPDNGVTATELLKHADAAMYTVKHSGKDGVALYDPERDEFIEERAQLVAELRQAIQNEELELFYQPIVDAQARRPVKVEALMRWSSPTRGSVPPAKFIPLAEENGLITLLGSYALRTACFQVKAWLDQGIGDIVVSVNVSAYQLQDPNFVLQVKQLLLITGINPAMIELELTESAIIQALEPVTTTLKALRTLGVSIALDDFGTGYSSLSYLEMLDFDTIKIDRSFAMKLTQSRKNPQFSVAIIRAVLEIADTLEAQVVAEGIETQEQLEIFRALGCQLLQGYYFGQPMSASKMTAMLQPLSRAKPGDYDRVMN